MNNLEDVFKQSGLPTITFVEPVRYNEIFVALRAAGRGVIIEGPSGIGKTMCVKHILGKLNLASQYTYLTPRIPGDLQKIENICDRDRNTLGMVIIDDFHLVPSAIQIEIGNLMKVLADEENETSKLVLIGINSTGRSLLISINDLLTRVSVFQMESNPKPKLLELITKGEAALKIQIVDKETIAAECCGSFYLCQDICSILCAQTGVLCELKRVISIDTQYKDIARFIMLNLAKIYESQTISFAQGNRIRKGTRPYYTILKWFAYSSNMTLNLLSEAKKRSIYTGGIKQVIDKDYIVRLFEKDKELQKLFFYNTNTKELCIDDPKYLFYLRNINWVEFQKQAGFDEFEENRAFDIAISFSGKQRNVASLFFKALSESLSVFYDSDNEQDIFGNDVDEFLRPIYNTDSRYVLALFSSDYPVKFWTRVEYEAFENRFPNKEVLPIYIGEGPSDPISTKIGFEVISCDVMKNNVDLEQRVQEISNVIIKKFQ